MNKKKKQLKGHFTLQETIFISFKKSTEKRVFDRLRVGGDICQDGIS